MGLFVFVVAVQVYYFCECETARRRFAALPKLELADGQKCATGQLQAPVQTDWRGPEPADFDSCLWALGRARRQRSAPLVGGPSGCSGGPHASPRLQNRCTALRHTAAVLAKFLTSHA